MAGGSEWILQQPGEVLEMIFGHLDEAPSKQTALVCPNFHDRVCYSRRNRSQVLALTEEIVEDDNVYYSIMNSTRRLNNIKVVVDRCEDKIMKRICAILKKFKTTMKIFSFASFSSQHFLEILCAASQVEELTLWFAPDPLETKRRRVKKFSKLKKLELHFVPDVQKLLEAIPDNSLEDLEICKGLVVASEILQTFFNRQKNIKKLCFKETVNVNIDHLKLEELTIAADVNLGNLNAALERQSELRVLKMMRNIIEIDTFLTICQLRKLENLEVTIEEGAWTCLEGLNNLQHLTRLLLGQYTITDWYWPFSRFLSRVHLPKLKNLILLVRDDLHPRLFSLLSHNMPSLEDLQIWESESNNLPVIIENCRTLRSVFVTRIDHAPLENYPMDHIPFRQNESIEELGCAIPNNEEPWLPIYASINACPNLKRLGLFSTVELDVNLLECLQRCVHLTHFRFKDVRERIDELDPSFSRIIALFRDSPNFVQLKLYGIPISSIRLVGEVLGKKVDDVAIKMFHEPSSRFGNCLEMIKKSA